MKPHKTEVGDILSISFDVPPNGFTLRLKGLNVGSCTIELGMF